MFVVMWYVVFVLLDFWVGELVGKVSFLVWERGGYSIEFGVWVYKMLARNELLEECSVW